jgi:hypothetical protein
LLLNAAMLCFAVLIIRRFAQVHWSFGLSLPEAIGIPTAIAMAALLARLLPKETQEAIAAGVISAVSSPRTTYLLMRQDLLIQQGLFRT